MPMCPNCQSPVEDSKRICPNCGADVSGVWPPMPTGFQPPLRSYIDVLLTRSAAGDFWVGFGSMLVLQLLLLVGVYFQPLVFWFFWVAAVVGGIAYAVVRRRHPIVARGIGWGLVTIPLFYLGALFVCAASPGMKGL